MKDVGFEKEPWQWVRANYKAWFMFEDDESNDLDSIKVSTTLIYYVIINK